MGAFKIRKGFDIRMAGEAIDRVVDHMESDRIVIHPTDFQRVKPRIDVSEGDVIQRGSVLFHDKRNSAFRVRSPAAGTVEEIVLGARRVVEQIVIRIDGDACTDELKAYSQADLAQASRDEILAVLLDTGLLALLQERPFSKIPDPEVTPKSIFINGMASAPLEANPVVAVRGQETAFQAGLTALAHLTEGSLHLCEQEGHPLSTQPFTGAEVHLFSGPHPSGNTSTHIHMIDPVQPGEQVWAIRAADVVQVGRLFLDGAVPDSRLVALAGSGLGEKARQYYRVRIGAPLGSLLEHQLDSEDPRIIGGHPLTGRTATVDQALHFLDTQITVIPEGRERLFMGWLTPGLNRFSRSPLLLSTWLRKRASWKLNTNLNGSHRAMVMTGWYDRYTPLNLMVDFLVKAVLAHDTDEAIKLGILETDPEDFALCTFICPSKVDVTAIIRQGLQEIEAEGL